MIKIITNIFAKYPLLEQLTKFGIVGTVAAIINMLALIALVELLHLHPLVANIFAFLLAFNASYIGHHHWSFAETARDHKKSVPRFFIVATTSFVLNQGLFAIFLTVFHLYYVLALFLVLIIVPIFTFLLSKFWAFT
ncbi:MAG: GtrA family protein [Gammaproteobacteria bacterium]|nr:GtrA family protein [Gammaproteobacteria bacterium]